MIDEAGNEQGGGGERALIEAALADVWPDGAAAPRARRIGREAPVPWPVLESYELVREIHRGAQGVVYEAIQTGTRRSVAVKVMREGPFAGARDRARFEREVYILGQLKHPNIVSIHESGNVAGHFYYVMDYVAGESLDVQAARGVPVREALRLFLKICEAVSAAHRIGVIHRDLKPGNVRVNPAGEPHVLDFGLAKVGTAEFFGEDRPQRMSMSGQFIGSLPWASPEQAEGRPELIDIRSDVYALGVILYQMLTGSFPYEVTGRLPEVVDRILRAEPVRPRTLRREVDDEVETIVLKCLDKDRDRRYQSAGELARDVRRHLAGEPIDAKRDSGWYVLRKALARHRVPAAVGAAFGVLVIAASIALTVMYGHSVTARQATEEFARKVGAMTLSFDPAAVADPFSPEVPDPQELRKVALLAQAVEDAHVAPALEADLRTTLGLAYLKLRVYDQAERHLARALDARRSDGGGDGAALAASLHNLGRALFFNSKFQEAEARYAQALDLRRRALGPTGVNVADSVNDLAACLMRQGRLQDAEARFREALEMRRALLSDRDPWVAASVNNLARCLMERGQFVVALELFEDALQRISALDVDPIFTVRGLRNIATCRLALGREAEAVEAAQDALDKVRALPGDQAPERAPCERLLARAEYETGALGAAEKRCREVLAAQEAGRGARDPAVADTRALLALVLLESAGAQEAEAPLEAALDVKRALLGDAHPEVAALQSLQARVRLAKGQMAGAEAWVRAALATQMDPQKLSPMHPAIADSMVVMGRVRLAFGDAPGAERALRDALRLRQETLPADHWRVGEAASLLGERLARQGKFEEAIPMLVESSAVLDARLGTDDPRAREAQMRMKQNLPAGPGN